MLSSEELMVETPVKDPLDHTMESGQDDDLSGPTCVIWVYSWRACREAGALLSHCALFRSAANVGAGAGTDFA